MTESATLDRSSRPSIFVLVIFLRFLSVNQRRLAVHSSVSPSADITSGYILQHMVDLVVFGYQSRGPIFFETGLGCLDKRQHLRECSGGDHKAPQLCLQRPILPEKFQSRFQLFDGCLDIRALQLDEVLALLPVLHQKIARLLLPEPAPVDTDFFRDAAPGFMKNDFPSVFLANENFPRVLFLTFSA
jgi:hypothetical protein